MGLCPGCALPQLLHIVEDSSLSLRLCIAPSHALSILQAAFDFLLREQNDHSPWVDPEAAPSIRMIRDIFLVVERESLYVY